MQKIRAFLLVVIVTLAVPTFAADPAPGLQVERSRKTGLATFVRAAHGGAIEIPVAVAGGDAGPADFLNVHGRLFGVTAPEAELALDKVVGDEIANTHSIYRQMFRGVPVFGGRLQVHQNSVGAVVAANGNFFPIPNTLRPVPTLSANEVEARAKSTLPAVNSVVEKNDLVIVDPGWYGDAPAGAHLAYHLILADEGAGVREAFFIDAHTGKILDRWNLLHTARDRRVFNDVTNVTVRTEGGPATGDPEADGAYDYAGDMYDYLFRAFGRDSIDDNGTILHTTVHLQSSSCPNAFGGTGGTSFCDGIVTDDIVAHEFAHGLTGFTADLIYQNQSGQLNESFSDVFGEAVDLLNGNASEPGTPGGTAWPVHGSGSGTDLPNDARTGCVASGVVTVNSPAGIAGDYSAQPASFGAPLTPAGISANVVVASPVRACNADMPFSNAASMPGKIVVVNRGDCNFTEKVKNAQNAGAAGVIVVNNVASGLPSMGGSDATVTIRSVGVSQADGNTIKNAAQAGTVNVTLRSNANPDVRWLVGEDSAGFGGAIRDMWMPSCMGHPDSANHPFQTCPGADNGGVHSGSGVPNHAFAMVVDGQTYNGYTVNSIGLFKAAAVWYRALTVYLTPTSDFGDAYIALNQSASDLVGQMISDPRDGSDFAVFTSQDAIEINNALLAVEMNTLGLCGANEIMNSDPPTLCSGRSMIYSNPVQPGGTNGWTTSTTGPAGPPTPYLWVLRSSGLPAGRTGTVWFGEDRNVGNCGSQNESAVHSLFSSNIVLPGTLASPTVAFTHYLSTEAGYDGGNVKISINGGAWQILPASAFTYNPYNTVLVSSGAGNTNPMAGQAAWSGGQGPDNTWGTSIIDLTGIVQPGNTVQFRFDMGKDGCSGVNGWFVDDFELFNCPLIDCNQNGDQDSTDIGNSSSADCDANGTPDECQIAVSSPALGGPFFCTTNCDPDCNLNAIPDTCEIAGNDCNANQIPDSCELDECAGSPDCADCNNNGLLDACDLSACGADPDCADCNENTVPDACDISAGAPDGNSDGIPDACQVSPVVPQAGVWKTRFLSFTPPAGAGEQSALRVRLVSLHHVNPPYNVGAPTPFTAFEGETLWVGPPSNSVESTALPEVFRWAYLQCAPHYRDWSTVGLVHVTGSAIVPSSIYEVERLAASCLGAEDTCSFVSSPMTFETTRWGDVDAPYNPPAITAQPDIADVSAMVSKFRSLITAPNKARVIIAGNDANGNINIPTMTNDFNFSHIAACVAAFRGEPYPYKMGKCATGGAACTTNSECTGTNAPPCNLYCP